MRGLDGKIFFDLKKSEANYTLTIKNLVHEQGICYGSIKLETNSKIKPEIIVRVRGMVKS